MNDSSERNPRYARSATCENRKSLALVGVCTNVEYKKGRITWKEKIPGTRTDFDRTLHRPLRDRRTAGREQDDLVMTPILESRLTLPHAAGIGWPHSL